MDSIVLIGYSGHGYVAADIIKASGLSVTGYCDSEIKVKNPFDLGYLGNEKNLTSEQFLLFKFFVGIGDNKIRKKVFEFIQSNGGNFINAIHPKSVVASSVHVGSMVMIAAGVCINPLVQIGNGVICNTISSIDHECIIGDFTHIAPGAVLCGNVEVGENSFIGAGSVIRQGIKIGNNCIIGAGSVVVKDVKTGSVVMGNPSRLRS